MGDVGTLVGRFRIEQLVALAHLRACTEALRVADEALSEVLAQAERAEFTGPGVKLFVGLLEEARGLRVALLAVQEGSQRRAAAVLAEMAQEESGT